MHRRSTFLADQAQEHIEILDKEFCTCFLFLVAAVSFALEKSPASPES
jgi:hypothetical protein